MLNMIEWLTIDSSRGAEVKANARKAANIRVLVDTPCCFEATLLGEAVATRGRRCFPTDLKEISVSTTSCFDKSHLNFQSKTVNLFHEMSASCVSVKRAAFPCFGLFFLQVCFLRSGAAFHLLLSSTQQIVCPHCL